MPRKPKIHILSPLDPSLHVKEEAPDAIPTPVVKALIAGMLSHLWSADRRKTKETGIPQEDVENMLWSHVVLATRNERNLSDNNLQSAIREGIPFVFGSLTGHTYRLFAAQSDLIIGIHGKISPPYSSLRTGRRIPWVKKNLADALATLKQYAPCHECRMNGSLPSDNILESWTTTANEGALRTALLAWFHDNMSPATVERILATKPPVPGT
jgi:hypothetical protein